MHIKYNIDISAIIVYYAYVMNQNKKELPKTSQQISDEAEKASIQAFAEQYPEAPKPYDWAKEDSKVTPIAFDVVLPAAKSDEQFLGEFFAETTANAAAKRVGDTAVGNIVQIDVSSIPSEQPITVQHQEVA